MRRRRISVKKQIITNICIILIGIAFIINGFAEKSWYRIALGAVAVLYPAVTICWILRERRKEDEEKQG